jgi:hypothetical protein
MNTALEYSTRVVQAGGRRCKKSTLNDLVHLTPLRIPLMNPPNVFKNIFFCHVSRVLFEPKPFSQNHPVLLRRNPLTFSFMSHIFACNFRVNAKNRDFEIFCVLQFRSDITPTIL